MYAHRYKFGKQKEIMTLAEFQRCITIAEDKGESLEALALIVLLWHTGVRVSEALERVVSDCRYDPDRFIVCFHKRKKGGEEVPPLQIPIEFFGVEEYLVEWWVKAAELKPSKKTLYFQVETDKTRKGVKGNSITVKKTASRQVKDKWLFPHMSRTKAWQIVKRVLGPKYYPHYLRLRKLTTAAKGGNNWFEAQDRIRAISGLKTMNAREAYIGTEAQSEAVMRESE